VYRAEVAITGRNSCRYEPRAGEAGITNLNRALRDHPDWPGYAWLTFRVPMEGTLPGAIHRFTQYVRCAGRPVRPEERG
jgi:hypothetical protein